jgi:hypothetical protein
MPRSAEPEREVVRRVAPFGPPAVVLAFLIGAAVGGWDAGWSAGIGVAVVVVNFVAHGLSLAWAAGVSVNVLGATAMAGFVIRLGVIAAILFWLTRFEWFSALAFGAAVVPATVGLLFFEMRLMSAGVGSELVLPRPSDR